MAPWPVSAIFNATFHTEAMSEFSTDATRFALADAGDSLEDANFETTTVNAAILRLFQQYEWTKVCAAHVALWHN